MSKLQKLVDKWGVWYMFSPQHDGLKKAMESEIKEFAKAVAEDALKRAAERASILFKKDGITATYFQIDRESIEVDKQSILSTEINLDLAIEKGAEG